MAHETTDARQPQVERAAHVVVPVGFAVVTWLVTLLLFGLVARLDSLSALNLLPLIVVVFMFWPLYRASPWRPGLTERVVTWARVYRDTLAIAAVLLVVRSIPFTPGLISGLLDLPFRSAGFMFRSALFYRQALDPTVGNTLLTFGVWYLELFWLFIIGSLLAGVLGRRD